MKLGIWLIGTCGNVSTCTIAGVEAIKKGLASKIGFVTELPEFKTLKLAPVENIEFSGHEIRKTDLTKSLRDFRDQNGVFDETLCTKLEGRLKEISRRIKSGVLLNCGKAVEGLSSTNLPKNRAKLRDLIKIIQQEILDFKDKCRLDQVVVINLASTEAKTLLPQEYSDINLLKDVIKKNKKTKISSSVIYAFSAIDAGFPYINFTSSPGSSIEAINQLSMEKRVPHFGKDAKTGETLIKTAILPLFHARNLKVLSWEGHNILGNRDGYVLSFAESRKSKIEDKKGVAKEQEMFSNVRIDYVPSLGDWKVAWDFIHFEGFLNTKMSLQFIWQGCDSILAAPLVIDLARLSAYAKQKGEYGPLKHLACFFKNPYKVKEQNFFEQFKMLIKYIENQRTAISFRPIKRTKP
jgi:myo-inositol-1-phosphate synthase